MTARLSLCMIVRDNERIIKDCLGSIKPWVDEMIVVDTGSVDATPDIARSLGAQVFSFPWCDSFAAARNESLRHATGDWLFWMDSDDTITPENGQRLRELVDGPHPDQVMGYVMQVHCPGAHRHDSVTVVDQVKLLRNHAGIRFEGRIHEQVLLAIRRLGGEVAWTDIHVVHANADHSPAGRQRKYARDLRLLELELQDQPDHPFCLFNFGMTYLDMGDAARAVDCLRRCIAVSGPDETHLRKAYALLLGGLGQLGQWDEALRQAEQAQRLFPDDPEIAFRQGIVLHALGRLPESVAAYQRALDRPKERFFASVDAGITGHKTRHNLGVVYRDQGRLDLAELQWRLALEERPGYVPSMTALGEVLIQQGKYVTAELECQRWTGDGDSRPVGLLTEAELLVARGEHALAVTQLARAVQEFPEITPIREAYCQRLFEAGRWPEARTALQDLVERRPEDGAAYHNLGQVLMQLNEPAAAAGAFERALAVRPGYAATQHYLDKARKMNESLTSVSQ